MSTDPKTGQRHDVRTIGWDCFMPPPGEYEARTCRVCGGPMAVERDVIGPTSWAEAMLVRDGRTEGHLHDTFHCTRSGEPWHRQALSIRQEAIRTASQRLADLLNEEADEIVRTRTVTRNL